MRPRSVILKPQMHPARIFHEVAVIMSRVSDGRPGHGDRCREKQKINIDFFHKNCVDDPVRLPILWQRIYVQPMIWTGLHVSISYYRK